MTHDPTEVASFVLRSIDDAIKGQIQPAEIDHRLTRKFPNINRFTMWHAYNVALIAFALEPDTAQ